jgi:multidrug efflux pump subunit AcrA (membrane-fusion protein)
VPRSAFNSWNIEQKKAELFVLEGDKARKRPVSLGIVQGETAQIVSGLKLGEAVITRGAFLLHDGDRVMVSGRKRL